MRRRHALLLIGLLTVMFGCTAAGWRLTNPPIDRWLVAGATAVQVEGAGFGQQRIGYVAPGQPYAWYFELLRRLAHDRWQASIDTRTRIRDVPDMHWRLLQLGPIYLEQQVSLQGGPNTAQIILRQRIIIPWQRWLQ